MRSALERRPRSITADDVVHHAVHSAVVMRLSLDAMAAEVEGNDAKRRRSASRYQAERLPVLPPAEAKPCPSDVSAPSPAIYRRCGRRPWSWPTFGMARPAQRRRGTWSMMGGRPKVRLYVLGKLKKDFATRSTTCARNGAGVEPSNPWRAELALEESRRPSA